MIAIWNASRGNFVLHYFLHYLTSVQMFDVKICCHCSYLHSCHEDAWRWIAGGKAVPNTRDNGRCCVHHLDSGFKDIHREFLYRRWSTASARCERCQRIRLWIGLDVLVGLRVLIDRHHWCAGHCFWSLNFHLYFWWWSAHVWDECENVPDTFSI